MITEGTTAVRASAARSGGKGRAPETSSSGSKSAKASSSLFDPSLDRTLVWKRVAWIACFLCWLFVAVALASFSPTDPGSLAVPTNQPPHNLAGLIGALVAHYAFFNLFGWGSWALLALGALALWVWGGGRTVTHLPVRVIGALMFAGAIACFQRIAFPLTGPVTGLPGGMLGVNGGQLLLKHFGAVGAYIVLIFAFFIAATVALDVWALIVTVWTGRVIFAGAKHTGRLTGRVAIATAQSLAEKRAAAKARADEAGASGRVRPTDVDDDENLAKLPDRPTGKRKKKAEVAEVIDPDAGGLGAYDSFDPNGSGLAAGMAGAVEEEEDEDTSPVGSDDDGDEDEEVEESDEETAEVAAPAAAQPKAFTADELRAKIAKLPVRFAAQTSRSATEEDLRDIQNQQNLEGYRFPGLDLLEEPEGNFSQTMEAFVREQAEALEKALKEYRIDGEVVGVESGPVITMYELRLAPGTKVAALTAVSSDLARSLKAVNIRIVPNMAGRDTVGVEVPNAQKEKVRLKELMTKSEVYANMRLPMFLGKDASGEPMIEDLSKMPHMLIAGTTGSGKSVCMNTIIMSFLYTKKPNELKLVLVDPKMVEMSQFKDIPHLMCPVVTEMSKAAAILEWAVNKMDERYELLAEAGCRDIHSYNEMTWEELKERFSPETPEEEAKIPRKLPYMVFVIDELADLMMTNKEVEHSIVRIAQKARAVGMHLILATQRPQANVVTGLIKSNMPARCAFKVASGMDSRIVLDQKGGELLLGQGDMLYLSPKSSKLTRAQGTLVDDKEIRRVVKFMREVAAPTFERQLMQLKSASSDEGESTDFGGEIDTRGLVKGQEDELFDQAVEVVLETKRGSVSLLQRRFGIGFTRAGRLIELMGEAGILGTHKGTVAREVTMTLEEWRAMKAQAAADAEAAERGEPSNPIADTLEQAQSIVNDGNLKEQLEESATKATDEVEDEEYAEEGADESDDEEAEDEDPPFTVETRVNGKPSSAR